MFARYLLMLLVSVGATSAQAVDSEDKWELGDIKNSIEKSQDTMHYVRTVNGSAYVPEPKHNRDKPSHSYFSLESYDIYNSQGGKRMVQAMVTNNSGGGITLKPNQIKAYFGNDHYVSPSKIDQDGSFAQGETKSVTLYFGETDASILGLITRAY
ncbi:hypothetical protein [Vibrio neptunius]|uniref:Uncharacterized protein n=1 Tax=Vibrio neptunius TaxID=170651 RepID=A0ABS3A4W1_9VIBR|nr:hypothetical protein [Vibrio neptunius]KJY86559.1 hypothetical protein TW84_19415 [Vibrio neptunius]MBN3494019.1 hypothetical protein [Vibrio neptunius]MBN3516516.1 hypothetical protein [Vibrio neptunius]MBN3550690.1 hypothetical protein [Vibrio neptunius]MBN3578821.1 hypothetical protein [Vibrio neptunius]